MPWGELLLQKQWAQWNNWIREVLNDVVFLESAGDATVAAATRRVTLSAPRLHRNPRSSWQCTVCPTRNSGLVQVCDTCKSSKGASRNNFLQEQAAGISRWNDSHPMASILNSPSKRTRNQSELQSNKRRRVFFDSEDAFFDLEDEEDDDDDNNKKMPAK